MLVFFIIFRTELFAYQLYNIEKPEENTVESVMKILEAYYMPIFNQYLKASFFTAYPEKITLIAIKDERKIEMWFEDEDNKVFIKRYSILGLSGNLGPKLKDGDKQVPEGFYQMLFIHPKSDWHLSIKLNYPNQFDKQMAVKDKRKNIGKDIYIHGGMGSLGCLAVGDKNIEEIAYIVYKTGIDKIKVIITPYDFRKKSIFLDSSVKWVKKLYQLLEKELKKYPFIKQADYFF